jgi:uncharacterized protein YndB with AHSA1/START domain
MENPAMPTDDLLLSEDQLPAEINHTGMIRAERGQCFESLTTVEGWNAWFTTSMFLDLKPGGVIIFEWKDFGAEHFSGGDHGSILEVVPDRKLAFTWHPDSPDYATRVELSLEDAPEGCLVRVRESGFRDDEQGIQSLAQSAVGWGEALTLLKMYLEHGIRY